MGGLRIAEHVLVIRFYDQPLERIDECIEALRLVAPGLETYATRPLQSTLNQNGIAARFAATENTECILIFDSAENLARFRGDARAKEIYSWFASPDSENRVITTDTHVLRGVPE